MALRHSRLCKSMQLFMENTLGGLGPPDPPISSPNMFCNISFTQSLSKIINLCTPPTMVGEIS